MAQVTISQFVGSSPVSGSVLTAQEPGACFGFRVSLSLPLPCSRSVSVSLCLCLCLSLKNKHFKTFFVLKNKKKKPFKPQKVQPSSPQSRSIWKPRQTHARMRKNRGGKGKHNCDLVDLREGSREPPGVPVGHTLRTSFI